MTTRSSAVADGLHESQDRLTGHHRRSTCRACGSSHLESFLDLGNQPLANAFPRTPSEFETELRFPLETFICAECALVQLVDVVDPAVMFREYIYVTGTSETMAEHNRNYASRVHERLALSPGDLVVDIGSNDGSLLSQFASLGTRTLGVEPATNIAAIAIDRGIDTVSEFFDAALAAELRATRGPAKAILANNVFAHVDDPVEFLNGCRALIADDGLIVIEVPYARDMLERGDYDTIYHEHLSYFTLGPLSRMARAAGLTIVQADKVAVHGGSLRVWFARLTSGASEVSPLVSEEETLGVTAVASWQEFGRRASRHREAMVAHLEALHREGASLAGYGAPAKGSTLMNYCGIGPDLLPFTVDRNPMKVGRWTPGTHVPVLPVDAIADKAATHVLILPWNIAGEIVRQQQDAGGATRRWMVPFPLPRYMTAPAG